ncbi:MAG TPA: DMT family transporter [Thermoleophilaceae bacterium]
MSSRHAAEAALVAIAAVWGLTFVMVQSAVKHLPVLAFLGYRFSAAALIVALIFRRELARLPRDGWRAGLAMGVFLTGGYLAQTFALEHTTASNAGFITGLFVVITPVLGAIFLRDHVGTLAWLAAALSALGLFLLSGTNGLHSGDALALLCAACFAAHILVTSHGVRSYNLGALLAVQLGTCGVVSLIAGALGGDLEAPSGGQVWSALLVTALIASALGFFVQSYAQQHASPARTALILASEPAFAGLFGYLHGDRLTAINWFGAVLIMVAVVGVEVIPRFRPPRPLPEG